MEMSAAAFKERLRGFGISFEKSLEDLIKGIRACNGESDKLSAFFDKSINECRQELKSGDLELKSMAILKLAYLEMYGFDMSWCSFYILEVMASSKFQHKRIGYLSAIQILQRQNNDDALMLMTNLLKKDINSVHYVETSLAISGIASVVSRELAIDVVDDMAKMLTHSKPLIRKKAVLAMYKILLKYPEALRQYYDRIVDKLNDDDMSVVSATVNVICELAQLNPGNYVELIPTLFGLLEVCENNWTIIRLLKLFAHLSVQEPRLKSKLLPEIIKLISHTMSLSICYECINSILDGNMLSSDDLETAELMVAKLIVFFEDDDLNLRYVGLLALIKTCKIRKDLIKKHDKILLTCIYENDLTIRETSLDIINPLVTEYNIVTIVTRLLVQLVPYKEQEQRLDEMNKNVSSFDEENSRLGRNQKPIIVSEKYKSLIVEKIIEVCSMNNYKYIPNFKWYLGVLVDIIHLNFDKKVPGIDKLISKQFIDMSIRVPSIRSNLVETCISLCASNDITYEQLSVFKNGLKDCIWIICEYYLDYIYDLEGEGSDSGDDSDNENENQKFSALDIFEVVSQQEYLKSLSKLTLDAIIPSYIHSVAKLYNKYIVSISEDDQDWNKEQFESSMEFANKIIEWFTEFATSTNILTQERALGYSEILKLVVETLTSSIENIDDDRKIPAPKFLTVGYRQLFGSVEIKPVNKQTQGKVIVPKDLDLETTIDDGAEFWENYNKLIEEEKVDLYGEVQDDTSLFDSSEEETNTSNLIELSATREAERRNRLKDDPYYIFDDEKRSTPEIESADIKEVKPKRSKKLSKPKIKREKVLILGDDENGDAEEAESSLSNNEKEEQMRPANASKFVLDSSKLATLDLKHDEREDVAEDEYKIDQQLEDLAASDFNALKIEISNAKNVEPVKRKPKKVKKKKAVIQ